MSLNARLWYSRQTTQYTEYIYRYTFGQCGTNLLQTTSKWLPKKLCAPVEGATKFILQKLSDETTKIIYLQFTHIKMVPHQLFFSHGVKIWKNILHTRVLQWD